VGDKLTAWWDAQRGMFIPCWQQSDYPFADANDDGLDTNPIHFTDEGGSDIRFALEILGGEEFGTDWKTVNDRTCIVNGRVVVRDGELQTLELPRHLARHNALARALVAG